MTSFSFFFILPMIVWIENVFEGGDSLNNYKNESDISIKMNGNEQTMLKKDDSFIWVLPKDIPRNENVVNLEDFQKKKTFKKIDKPKSKKIKNAEIILLLFFAVIIGGLFGTSLLKILPESEVTNNPKSTQSSLTLEPVNVFVEQVGVFSELSGAESVSKELSVSAILKKDKYYVLTNISDSNIGLSDSSYIKQFATESFTIDDIDIQSKDSLLAIRNLLNSFISSTSNVEQWTDLSKNVVKTSDLDSTLIDSALTAYEDMKLDRDSIQSKQAVLDFFVMYHEFISNYKK